MSAAPRVTISLLIDEVDAEREVASSKSRKKARPSRSPIGQIVGFEPNAMPRRVLVDDTMACSLLALAGQWCMVQFGVREPIVVARARVTDVLPRLRKVA